MLVTNFLENNFKFFLPEFFLVSAILLLTLYGSVFTVSKKYNFPLIHISMSNISLLVLSFSFFLVVCFKDLRMLIFNGIFICDGFSQGGKLLILFSTIVYLIFVTSYLKKSKLNSFEYQILILVSVLGLMLLCSSYDLLSLYLALELLSLCFYVLAAFNRESAFSTEAGLKYFILGAFSSGLLLFGISIIYGFTGTTNFESLRLLLSLGLINYAAIKIGIAFLACALLFKMAAAPFHIWTPDVYEGAPLSSTVFFAVVPKIGILFIVLRVFLFSFGSQPEFWQYLFSFSALFSVVVGSFLALKQRKIKRLFAYSSIAQVGYLLLSVSTGELEGSHSAIIFLIIYIITSVGVWSIVIFLSCQKGILRVSTLTDFSLIGKANPLLGASCLILLFSLAGVPPLSGFYAKFCVFVTSLNASYYIFSLLILLTSVVSSYYYLRLLKTVYFEIKEKRVYFDPISKEITYCVGFSCSFLIFFFVNPSLLWLFTYEMLLSLFY